MGLAANIAQAVPPIWDVNGLELMVLDPPSSMITKDDDKKNLAGPDLFISGIAD